MNLFAHAGEVHEDSAESAWHLLAGPFVAIPLFLLFVVAIYIGLKALKISSGTILLAELVLFFVVGIGAYNLAPAVSIFALSVGITATLFVVLSNLAHG